MAVLWGFTSSSNFNLYKEHLHESAFQYPAQIGRRHRRRRRAARLEHRCRPELVRRRVRRCRRLDRVRASLSTCNAIPNPLGKAACVAAIEAAAASAGYIAEQSCLSSC